MYKAAARWMIRRNIQCLNNGKYQKSLSLFAQDALFSFPGNNSWSNQHRVPQLGREVAPTHQGKEEIEVFLQRYVGAGIQMQAEDILVNGPPWNTRAAVRVHVWSVDEEGNDRYTNRAILYVHSRWGKIIFQEDYEDTERATKFDLLLSSEPSL